MINTNLRQTFGRVQLSVLTSSVLPYLMQPHPAAFARQHHQYQYLWSNSDQCRINIQQALHFCHSTSLYSNRPFSSDTSCTTHRLHTRVRRKQIEAYCNWICGIHNPILQDLITAQLRADHAQHTAYSKYRQQSKSNKMTKKTTLYFSGLHYIPSGHHGLFKTWQIDP